MVKHRRTRRTRKQRGGSGRSCSARPMNRQSFRLARNQRGGVAPFGSIGDELLTGAARTWSEVAPLDSAISESQILAKQAGGRRRSRRHRRSRRRSHRRSQRGGDLQAFSAPYNYGFHSRGSADFASESSVNPSFGLKGAQ